MFAPRPRRRGSRGGRSSVGVKTWGASSREMWRDLARSGEMWRDGREVERGRGGGGGQKDQRRPGAGRYTLPTLYLHFRYTLSTLFQRGFCCVMVWLVGGSGFFFVLWCVLFCYLYSGVFSCVLVCFVLCVFWCLWYMVVFSCVCWCSLCSGIMVFFCYGVMVLWCYGVLFVQGAIKQPGREAEGATAFHNPASGC